MTKILTYNGFCPTLNTDYSIDVRYSQITGNRYLQTGANCEYASFNQCPNLMNCPIRIKAPKETTF